MIQPKLQFLDEGRQALLLETLRYNKWIAPKGLVFDGASIPKLFWWLIGSPFTGYYRIAVIFHDVYYKDHRGYTRKEIDIMFYDMMIEYGVDELKAQIIYAAVRIGDKRMWNKHND